MANHPTEANIAAQSTAGEHGAVPQTGEEALFSTTEQHDTGHAAPSALGMDSTAWVALAMVAVIALMLWKKVPAAIGRALDKKIGAIRDQLDEAAQLRAEAEALKAEYEAKTAQAGEESRALLDRARAEADALVVQARADADALVERRTRMAEDRIAAAERSAIAEVRAKAADAATAAAATLIAERNDAAADRALIDQTISSLRRPN